MRSRTHIGIVVAAAAILASCGGDAPSTPSAPPTPAAAPYEVTLVGTAPPGGSTILATECRADSFVRPSTGPLCAALPTLTFVVRSDRAIPLASLSVEFYTSTELRCAVGHAAAGAVTPGVPTTITSQLTFLSRPPDEPQFCDLPATTTRIVAHLLDETRTTLLTTEFPQVYTFVTIPSR